VANDLTGLPFVIDTPGVSILTTDLIRIKGIRWYSPSAVAGHLAEIRDAFDRVKWRAVATGPNYEESDLQPDEKIWNGLKVPVLQSGQLFIEVW